MTTNLSTQTPVTLIVVDCQYDFYHPQGSLYVSGAENIINPLVDLINTNKNISEVVFTVDWHPAKHSSFKTQGGIWPSHCIAYSEGSQINPQLINACLENDIPYSVVRKGEVLSCEEYGAFSHITPLASQQWQLETATDKVLCNNNRLVVAGIAGDYCVLETVKNLLKAPFSVELFTNGIVSIDGGETLKKFVEEKKLTCL